MQHIDELLRIIAKTAEQGRNKAFKEKHSRFIDSFQHIEDEANRARKWLNEATPVVEDTRPPRDDKRWGSWYTL